MLCLRWPDPVGTAASLASRERVWKVLLGALLPEAQVTGAADRVLPADGEGPISRDGDLREQGRAHCLDICEEKRPAPYVLLPRQKPGKSPMCLPVCLTHEWRKRFIFSVPNSSSFGTSKVSVTSCYGYIVSPRIPVWKISLPGPQWGGGGGLHLEVGLWKQETGVK